MFATSTALVYYHSPARPQLVRQPALFLASCSAAHCAERHYTLRIELVLFSQAAVLKVSRYLLCISISHREMTFDPKPLMARRNEFRPMYSNDPYGS